MPNYSKPSVILIRYPFSDLSGAKVRPAVVVNTPHISQDLLIVPVTHRTIGLLAGEFVLSDWKGAGLNVPSAAKRGVYTIHQSLVIKVVGQLVPTDVQHLEQSLREWFGL